MTMVNVNTKYAVKPVEFKVGQVYRYFDGLRMIIKAGDMFGCLDFADGECAWEADSLGRLQQSYQSEIDSHDMVLVNELNIEVVS